MSRSDYLYSVSDSGASRVILSLTKMPALNQEQRRTVVCVPMDAHGHINAMLSLAGELKSLGYRTIFVTGTAETPKTFGHELILLESNKLTSYESRNEQDAYLKATLFDKKFNGDYLGFNLELAGEQPLDEVSMETHMHNFSLWSIFFDEQREIDANLEKVLINLKPDLVLVENLPVRPTLWRLAQDDYARKVAGWSQGLRWVSLASIAPLSLYYFADLMHTFPSPQRVPSPWLGLPTRQKLTDSQYRAQDEYFKEVMISSKYASRAKNLGNLVPTNKANTKSVMDAKTGEVLLNQSNWLNVYMYPRELDYNDDFKLRLDESLWIRVDALVRPTSNSARKLDQKSERLLSELESWQASKSDAESKVIYLSMGTVVSNDLDVMEKVMQQVFTCLREQPKWRFAVSLGMRHLEVEERVKDQLVYWRQQESRLIAEGWWPQPEVFRRRLVDVCVVHGGNNTICELFYFSSPLPALIIFPGLCDQLDNARRIEELGYGVALPVGRLLRSDDDELLLKAVRKSILVHDSNSRLTYSYGSRRGAKYCAKIISEKLESELAYIE